MIKEKKRRIKYIYEKCFLNEIYKEKALPELPLASRQLYMTEGTQAYGIREKHAYTY